jgi:hypothetical protein
MRGRRLGPSTAPLTCPGRSSSDRSRRPTAGKRRASGSPVVPQLNTHRCQPCYTIFAKYLSRRIADRTRRRSSWAVLERRPCFHLPFGCALAPRVFAVRCSCRLGCGSDRSAWLVATRGARSLKSSAAPWGSMSRGKRRKPSPRACKGFIAHFLTSESIQPRANQRVSLHPMSNALFYGDNLSVHQHSSRLGSPLKC